MHFAKIHWIIDLCDRLKPKISLQSMLQKELKDIERDKESGVRVELIGNSIRHLTGYVQGGAP